jgi:hypothetical protein
LILFLAYYIINNFQNIKITKTHILITHFFLIEAYELTTSFITVKWRHPKNAIHS